MTSDEFIGYVGDPDFHDGAVLHVVAEGNQARVVVRGASGHQYAVEFHGVKVVRSKRAEGMTLYALSEMRTRAFARRFVFSNWVEDDDASLEVEAEGFIVMSLT
jgi:hypothetical protein